MRTGSIWLWTLMVLLLSACSHQRVREPEPRQRAVEAGCQPLSEEDRERILSEADPDNFPATRYRRGPSSAKGIEKEADCSTFVHEVYKRAGLPYRFAPTAGMGNLREFDILPEKEARAGDMMLFRGHVGIVREDGKIISALSTRYRKRKSSIAAIDRKHFKTFRGKRYVLRYRCLPESHTMAKVRGKAKADREDKIARAVREEELKRKIREGRIKNVGLTASGERVRRAGLPVRVKRAVVGERVKRVTASEKPRERENP